LLHRIILHMDRISWRASRTVFAVGLITLVAIMLLTFIDVFMRYLFNKPIMGALEITEYMMVIFVSFGLGYCAMEKGHIVVDFVITRLGSRVQKILAIIVALLYLGLITMVTWFTFIHIRNTYDSGILSNVLLIPVYPFVAAAAIGFTVFLLVVLTGFLDSISRAVTK
jgi:TRAP-type C4-dicarboxylate transport system permease small subunit